jgi:DNA invertase Pin-like site-specific DNA recombinase
MDRAFQLTNASFGDFVLGSEVMASFTLHIYAALAQQERRLISLRTSAGLQAAKARGVKLGRQGRSPISSATLQRLATRSWSLLRETVDLSAHKAAGVIEARGLGKISLRTVMRARVRLGLGKTPRRGVGRPRPGYVGIAIGQVSLVY